MPDYKVRLKKPDGNGGLIATTTAANRSAAEALVLADSDHASDNGAVDIERYDNTEALKRGASTELTLLAVAADTAKLTDDSVNLSNQSTAPLTASSTFTGIFESFDGYLGALVTSRSNVAGATNGLQIEWSIDGITTDFLETFTPVANNGNFAFSQFLPRRAAYARPKYTNGITNQTTFSFAFRRVNQAEALSMGSGSSITAAIDQTTPGTTNRVDIGNIPTVSINQATPGITNRVDVGTPTVTANAGTNLNTSTLALEAGGNLAEIFKAIKALNNALDKFAVIGGQLDDVSTNVATENNVASLRITPQRAIHTNLRDQAGVELGTIANPLRTASSGTGVQAVGNLTGGVLNFGNDNRLRVGTETLLINDPIKGNTINSNTWIQSTLTMFLNQSSGLLTFNSGASTAILTYAILTSIRRLSFVGSYPIVGHWRARVRPQANSVIEFGFGDVSTTLAPTDGIFFRWDTTATLKGVVNNNGSETLTSALAGTPTTPLDIFKFYDFQIIVFQNKARFIIDLDGTNVVDTTLNISNALGSAFNVGTLPAFNRVYNSGSAPASAPQLIVGIFSADQIDLITNKTWNHQLVSIGKGAYQNPFTPFTQLANWVNSTAPASATLSNTAAGYTTLGGLYQFAAVLGSTTDYLLFAFQVPIGCQLVLTGIDISSVIMGADQAGSATVFQWGIGLNSSAASLATTESPSTSWAPRRIGLGMMGFGQTDNRGATREIVRIFETPLVVDSGRFLQIILTIPLGTATPLETFRGEVNIHGFFDIV